MDTATFEQCVNEAVDALPRSIKLHMENVAIVIEDEPTTAQRREQGIAANDIIFGLYEGVPLTERGIHYASLPDKITIFKEQILAAYRDPNAVRECIMNTVWHEIAHHVGFDDPWIEHEEHRRGKTR